MTRDREATCAKILEATEQIIVAQGVGSVGMNAVAAAAGVDKVLIYRYFGGREGLIREVATRRELWPAPRGATHGAETLGEEFAAALLDGVRSLRDQPFARRAIGWSMSQRDEFAGAAALARNVALRQIAERLREHHQVPRYLDLDAFVSVLFAAVAQLGLLASDGPEEPYGALELRQGDDWRRIERMLITIVQALCDPP